MGKIVMRNYQTIVVFAPKSDICWDNWQEKINKKYFSCCGLVALKELKKFVRAFRPQQLNYFVISLIKTELWIFLINLIGLV